MHKKLKKLIENTKAIFSQEVVDKIAKKTGFVKRNNNINASTFLAFNILLSNDMCIINHYQLYVED